MNFHKSRVAGKVLKDGCCVVFRINGMWEMKESLLDFYLHRGLYG